MQGGRQLPSPCLDSQQRGLRGLLSRLGGLASAVNRANPPSLVRLARWNSPTLYKGDTTSRGSGLPGAHALPLHGGNSGRAEPGRALARRHSWAVARGREAVPGTHTSCCCKRLSVQVSPSTPRHTVPKGQLGRSLPSSSPRPHHQGPNNSKDSTEGAQLTHPSKRKKRCEGCSAGMLSQDSPLFCP